MINQNHELPANLDTSNPEWQQALHIVRDTEDPVFLTGKAGTGKSTFLKYVCKEVTKKKLLAAPTGIAAINVRGVTLHSMFQLPFGPLLPGDRRLEKIKMRKKKRELLKAAELIIIDEVSMVRADIMDAIDTIMRQVTEVGAPFGGKQLLLVGDLFQLEPVVTSTEMPMLSELYETPFFFSAHVFRELELVNIELTTVYRQQDERFIRLLNQFRTDMVTPDDLEEINQQYQPDFVPEPDSFYITLTARREKADVMNIAELMKLPGLPKVYQGHVSGQFPTTNLPAEMVLQLKVGAQVIFTKNDLNFQKRWVNGTIGVIEELNDNIIKVRLPGGRVLDVEPEIWEHIRYDFQSKAKNIKEEVVGTFTQFPLRLAWAITIHKSQGLTFEKVILELGKGAFAAGQLYVALSRCTTLEGIRLKTEVDFADVIIRPEVVDFYSRMNRDKRLKAKDGGILPF